MPTKPTRETGEHAASYMALNTFSLKQAARIFDLVYFRDRSSYKHACQTFSSRNLDELREELTIRTDGKVCPQNNRGSSEPKEAWDGDEIFEITYTDKNWNDVQKISLVRSTRVSLEINIPQLKADVMLDHEAVQFIRTAAGVYNFEYKGAVSYGRTQQRRERSQNQLRDNIRTTEDDSLQKRRERERERDRRRDREISGARSETELTLFASGSVQFNPRGQTTWNLFTLNMTYARTRNNNPEKEAHLSLSNQGAQNLILVCGMPVGKFAIEQTIITPNKSSTYAPVLAIDQQGSIVVDQSRLQPFQSPSCRGSTQNLQGFNDFFQTLKAAEEINIITTSVRDMNIDERSIMAQPTRAEVK